jgi:hypothetical protein
MNEPLELSSRTRIIKKGKQWVGFLDGRKVYTSPIRMDIGDRLYRLLVASPTFWPDEEVVRISPNTP